MHGEVPTKRNKKAKVVHAVDLFCGAGGSSTGLINASNDLGYQIKLVAINHWDVAIATHSKNHEDVVHHCQAIESLNPEDIVPEGRLQILIASPSCTHHSNARGGKPRSDQKRADPWLIMKWVDQLYIENILIENVPEMITWGPLTARGKPDKRYKGMYFQQWLAALSVNYTVEYRVLNCADYGDPTTRKRFFLLAKRGKGKKIVWPERTHASRKELAKMAAQPDLFGESEIRLEPWVAAKSIIDWSLEGKSIFGRKKDLSPNTLRRIFKGLEEYGLKKFLVNLKGSDRRDRDINEPTFTQAAGGNHQGVVDPFIVPFYGEREGQEPRTRDINEPAPTVTTHGRMGVVEATPFIVPQNTSPDTRDIEEPVPTLTTTSRGVGVVEAEAFVLSQASGGAARDVNEPVPTIPGRGAHSLIEIEPIIVGAGGQNNPARSVNEPLRTVLADNHLGVVEGDAFLMGQPSNSALRPVEEPVPTVLGAGKIAKVDVQPFMVSAAHGGNTNPPRDIEEPLGAVLGTGKHAVVEGSILPSGEDQATQQVELSSEHRAIIDAFLVRLKANQGAESLDDPVKTLTTKESYGLVETESFLFNMAHTGKDSGDRDANYCKPTDEPVSTIAGKGMYGLVETDPFLVTMRGDKAQNRDIEEPCPTLLTGNHHYVAQPYIVKFYGNETSGHSIDEPLGAVTTKERFGLCIPTLGIVLDIRFRMLQVHELAAAMSFPVDYEFMGNRENKVKQIGNAVPLKMAQALCKSLLSN